LSTAGGITTAGGTLDLGGQGQNTSGPISFQGGGVQNGTLTEAGATNFDAQAGVVTAILAGNVGLDKTTSGTFVVGGSNVYIGKTTINAGLLQLLGPNGALPPAAAITITGGTFDLGGLNQSTSGAITFQGGLVQSGTLTAAAANNFAAQSGTITAVLAGSVSLAKTTTGTVLLSANNVYTGNTTVSAGLLQLAGTNSYAGSTTVSGGTLQSLVTGALPATTTLILSGSPTVDLAGTSSQTIAALTATAAGTSVIQNIGAGQTLSIVSTTAGAAVSVNALTGSVSVSLAASGSGALAITATNGSFQMNLNGTSTSNTTVNLSGLSTFSANVNEFDVGINSTGGGAGGFGLMTLAASNTITAQNFYVGKGPNNIGGSYVNLNLGLSNTFNVANLFVATGKFSTNGCVVSFNGQPGVLNLYGATGPGSFAEATLGQYTVNNTGNSPTGTIDLTGGTANVNIDTLTLGTANAATLNAQTPTGTFIFTAGAVNVNNLLLGVTTASNTANSGQPRGIFTIGGGTLTVNSTFTIGQKNGATTPVGTFNLNGGVALVKCDITNGNGTSIFNFNGGTLAAGLSSTTFMQGLSLASVANGGAIIDTAGNSVSINQNLLQGGNGGLTKLDAGMLVLGGSNTYVGGTTVTGGTLQVASPTALGAVTGPLTIQSATVDLNGNSPTVGALTGNAAALITNASVTNSMLTVGGSATTTYAGTIVNGPNGPATTVALAMNGSGTLYLSGTNSYSGGTYVENGTLVATNSQAIADGTNLTVGSPAPFPAAIVPGSAQAAVVPVPEPGTLVLLSFAAFAGLFAAARHGRRRS
jgi:autotransporter-associated beta strand protein